MLPETDGNGSSHERLTSHADVMNGLPVVEAMPSEMTAVEAFRHLSGQRYCVFLDSALSHAQLGRYSFVAADPFKFIQVPADGTDGLSTVENILSRFAAVHDDRLPPFQGGAAGLLSYELRHCLETLPYNHWDEFRIPAIAVGFYDVVLAYDHVEETQWIISQGFPETDPKRRRQRAVERIKQFQGWLRRKYSTGRRAVTPQEVTPGDDIPLDQLAPQYEMPEPTGLTSNFSAQQYIRAVERAIEYINAGDVFQVNLSQRLLYPASSSSVDLYLRLRDRNPATFAGYFDFGDAQVVSASPERFVRAAGNQVEARPIKGTRQRTSLPEVDLFAASELQASAKDRAENVMIVDLLRNDLSRVCRPDTVHVEQLCDVEVYQFVQHLVSSVRGELRPNQTSLDLVRASFPGGSITGAPKIRAMEIISELEPTARGAYCGSLGYVGFDGWMDLNILIRTITAKARMWQLPAGGGIVAQSNPKLEYEETWHKAEGMLRALN